jgi:hypothetical protein
LKPLSLPAAAVFHSAGHGVLLAIGLDNAISVMTMYLAGNEDVRVKEEARFVTED